VECFNKVDDEKMEAFTATLDQINKEFMALAVKLGMCPTCFIFVAMGQLILTLKSNSNTDNETIRSICEIAITHALEQDEEHMH
jgi:chromosome segregation ATPase